MCEKTENSTNLDNVNWQNGRHSGYENFASGKRRRVGALLKINDHGPTDNGTPSFGFENALQFIEQCVTKPYAFYMRRLNNAHHKAAALIEQSSKGATIYANSSPGIECAVKLIIITGIKRVVYSGELSNKGRPRIVEACRYHSADYGDLNE